MIDYIHSVDELLGFNKLFSKVYPSFKKWGLDFYPNKIGPVENLRYYEADFNKLVIRITPRGLEFYNSLHKFYHGNNYGNFTLKQQIDCIKTLCLKFQSEPSDFKVLSFEFGINLFMSIDIDDLIRCILNYKTTGMEFMRKGKIIFGVKFVLNQIEYKIYNKTLEVKLRKGVPPQKNILRVEIKILKQQYLNNEIKTLEDFMSIDKLQLCFDKLIGFLNKVTLLPSEEMLRILTHKQRTLLTAGHSNDYWRIEKMCNQHTAKKTRTEYLSLMKRCSIFDNRKERIINTLVRKFDKLIKS